MAAKKGTKLDLIRNCVVVLDLSKSMNDPDFRIEKYPNRGAVAIRKSIFKCLFKGSQYPSHFILEINVGKSRIRHRTTIKLNDEFLDRLNRK